MAPPMIFKPKEGVRSPGNSSEPASKNVTVVPNKVDKYTRYPDRDQKQHEFTIFSRFPAEIQQKIWVEALQKPACHTFKFVRSRDTEILSKWDINLQPKEEVNDTSAYRYWKSLLHCKPKKPAKLMNIGFQTGFRLAMVEFTGIFLRISKNYQLSAAINSGTDLVIIEFERGRKAPAFTWFEHSTTRMDLNTVRHRMRHFKRVAIHYKADHVTADKDGPLQCYCPPPVPLGCYNYKACCSELACFLDCFENLEEFYFVVEQKYAREKKWATKYKKKVCQKGYRLTGTGKHEVNTLELSHFFGKEREYIQHCPPKFLKGLEIAESPFVHDNGPRECLLKAMHIYRGDKLNEVFVNSQEKRKAVKFGLLLEYPVLKSPLDDDDDDDDKNIAHRSSL